MSGSIAFLGYCKGCDQPMLDGDLGSFEYDSDGQAVRHYWCEGTWTPVSTIRQAAREISPAVPAPRRAPAAARGLLPALPASASPIEKMFWDVYRLVMPPELDGLVPQYRVDHYRIDFAVPARKIGIELDGFASHSKVADITKDRYRQRYLEGHGWFIIRFGGSEVKRDAVDCVRQAAWLAVNYRRGHLE